MPSIADTFSPDIFTSQALTMALDKIPRIPGRVGQMGLFEEVGIAETEIVIEEYNGAIALIPKSDRGGPGQPIKGDGRTARELKTIHVQADKAVKADDVTGVRAFGSSNVRTLADKVNRDSAKLRRNIEITQEYQRMGALQGVILDSDGSTTIYNLFTEFGVSETTVDFAFTTATTDIRGLCMDIARAIEDAIGGAAYTGIHCFCGATWFDALTSHAKVEDALKYYESGAQQMKNDVRRGFTYGGITFEEYRHTVSGVAFLPATQARAFPVGMMGGYQSVYSPADFLDAVGGMGQPFYARMYENPGGKSMQLEVQTNAIHVPAYPAALIKCTQS
jgi:hypothetical protein